MGATGTSDAANATRGAASGTVRNPFWDNARFACIVLVVMGHALQRMTADSEAALALYVLIYAFHMPAFAIMSGYFSKSDPPSGRQMARVISDLVVPYIIFESLWAVTQWAVTGGGNINFTKPSWTLWFLLSLAIFRLVLPYLALLRWPLAWTVVVSIGAGYLPNLDTTLSISRTLALLPFFTLGWWLNKHDVFARLRFFDPRPWWVPALAAATFVAAGWAAFAFADSWNALHLRGWLFYRDSYADIGADQWWAGGVRLLVGVIAVVLTGAFLILVPRGQYRWSRFGQYTMYIYLLHSFVLYPFRESGFLSSVRPDWLWIPIAIVGSIVIAFLLGSRPVRWLTSPLVEPRLTWLFTDPEWGQRKSRPTPWGGSAKKRD